MLFADGLQLGTNTLVATAISSQPNTIGTDARIAAEIRPAQDRCPVSVMVDPDCAVGVGVEHGDDAFVPDVAVGGDAAAQPVTVDLGGDVGDHGGLGGGDVVDPRQHRGVDALRLASTSR